MIYRKKKQIIKDVNVFVNEKKKITNKNSLYACNQLLVFSLIADSEKISFI